MNNNATENKKGFLQNDKLLVCSMFVFYGLCTIGLIAGTFVWLGQRNATISADATSTAQTVATEKANATATAVVRATEQAQYEFIDTFDENTGWLVGSYNNDYFTGSSTIYKGVYTWNILKIDKTFTYFADTNRGNNIKDFDTYVDTKIVDAEPGEACSGFVIRKPGIDWNRGSYIFSVCNDSYFNIYHHIKDDWESISGELYSDAVKYNDWNRLGINARGDQFTFTINNAVVYEMTDDRQPYGKLSLYIQVNGKDPLSILFDNFGFQSR